MLNLPKDDPVTDQALLEFEYKAIHHELEPFFASEPVPQEQEGTQSLTVVGKTLGEFVRRKERVKVVLLYSLTENCQACPAILEQYQQFAADYPRKEEVTFGHFNTLLNDHPAIRDEKTPNLIIFAEERHHAPYEMPADDFQQLDVFLHQLLSESAEDDSFDEPSEDETL